MLIIDMWSEYMEEEKELQNDLVRMDVAGDTGSKPSWQAQSVSGGSGGSDRTCNNCSRKGHIAKDCRQSSKSGATWRKVNVLSSTPAMCPACKQQHTETRNGVTVYKT